jgi:hypothetical protein
MPHDNGFETTPENNAHMMFANVAASGLMIMPIGYCMQLFGFQALVVIIFLCAGVMFYVLTHI